MRSLDRFQGCLIGGAAGDALGYAIEFQRENEIFRRYGETGITQYELHRGTALISDDTQMTLFTANGLLCASARGCSGNLEETASLIGQCSRDWARTQAVRWPPMVRPRYAWLGNVPELYSPRAPGNTCLSALGRRVLGTLEQPTNSSKGCGAVMRVAPIGLYYSDSGLDVRDICRLGAMAAVQTHGHMLGWLPAAVLVQIIHGLSQDDLPLETAITDAIYTAADMWPEGKELDSFIRLMEKAVRLSHEDMPDLDAIHALGEGWVGDEALAIAVYCALKYSGDLDSCLIAAVNHKGDSDSTGAIAGNIIGAQIGLSGIPAKYTEHLELKDLILEIGEDLWRDGPADPADPVWEAKYVRTSYPEGTGTEPVHP